MAMFPHAFVRGLRLPLWASLILIAGCASGPFKAAPEKGALPEAFYPPDPRVELQYRILVGETAIQRGLRRQAAEAYVEALEYSDDPELAQRATRIALFAGEPKLAYRAALAWSQADPNNLDAHKTAARMALRTKATRQLATHADAVIRLHPDGPAVAFQELADVLSDEPEAGDTALAVMNGLVNEHTTLPEAHYAQGLLALRYDRVAAADVAIDRALELRPDWPDAVLLRAGILVRQGRLSVADELVSGLPGSNAERAEYYLSYAQLLANADRADAAVEQFERVLELDPGHDEARYGLGMLSLSLERFDRAESVFKRLYWSGRYRNDAAFYLGAIAEHQEEYPEARRWYSRVQEGARLFESLVRQAATYYEAGDLVRARAELQKLRSQLPEMAERLYVAEGELLSRAQHYREALELYNEALTIYINNGDLLYARSLVWERLGWIERAEADLRLLLKQEPGDPRALNALGYMLSNHSERYQEALDYIERALDADPGNPVIIDSMGWVHYRLGNLETAREYLERAYADVDDPEVAAHLGEVLWKLGDKQRAREIWEEARADDPDHPILRETVERLIP